MRKLLFLGALFIAAAAVAAPAAYTDNPQFNRGPNYSATTTALTATGKATGMGNSTTEAFLTADEIDVTFRCQNHGQNFAGGHPATSTNVTGPVEDIAPHNGQITFNVPRQRRCPMQRTCARVRSGPWS